MTSDDKSTPESPEINDQWVKDERTLQWPSSPERQAFLKAAALYVVIQSVSVFIFVNASMFLIGFNTVAGPITKNSENYFTASVLAVGFGLIILGGVAYGSTMKTRHHARAEQRIRLEAQKTKLAAANGDSATDFNDLWRKTQQRLEVYHTIATEQAAKSYATSQKAIGYGFGALILSVAMVAFSSSTTGAIAAGSIGIAGGALGGYLAKTFVRMHELSTQHLRAYFDQPLVLSQQLALERLLANLPDAQRAEAVNELIRGLSGRFTPSSSQSSAEG